MTINKKVLKNQVGEPHQLVNSSSLPLDGMIRARQLLPYLPFGRSTLWQWSRDGRFPAPIKLSNTITAWRNRDVIAWLDSTNNILGHEEGVE